MGAYSIPDTGRLMFSWVGPKTTSDNAPHFGEFGLSFLLTMLDGIDIQAGIATHIPKDGSEHDIKIGLAAHYTGDGLGVKFRTAVILLTNDEMQIVADVMPWFALDAGTFFVNITIGTITGTDIVGWELNPYFNMPMSGGNFRIGFRLWSNFGGDNNYSPSDMDGKMKYSLPLRFVVVF